VIAGRQVHHKRFDLAIRACNELSLPLTVIGKGPMHVQLRRMAGPTITFKTDVTDEQMPRFFHEASGFIFPNEEDFGVVAVEAMAAGCPVVAYRAGGSLDTVKENISGVFFDKQTVEDLKEAIKNFQSRHFSEDRIVIHAKEFDSSVFEAKMREYIFRHIS
ncbi:MAG: glycosyltransferase, partial [Patescibacteria group bacterium]